MEIEDRIDCMGIPLKDGDLVAFAQSNYADVQIAVIVGFTPKKIKMKRQNGTGHFTKFPNQIVSIEANKEVFPEFFL